MSGAELLARHFADFVSPPGRDGSAPAPLWLAAYLASLRTSEGNVAVDLSRPGQGELPAPLPPLEELLEALRGSPGAVTTDPAATGPCPLVLAGSRLYLHRYWAYEQEVVGRIGALAGAPAAGVDRARLASAFRELFPDLAPESGGDRFGTAAWIAVTRRLAIVTGGPGTGKTSVAARLLAFLAAAGGETPLLAALAAPTGKAAQRLTESIRRQLVDPVNHIPPRLQALVPTEASTLHRLLGWSPATRAWKRTAADPLDADVVVVDEASMADLPMMARLLTALKPGSRLVLLGDRDQLASVEAGFVLGDLCGEKFDGCRSPALAGELAGLGIPGPSPDPAAPPLADAVVVLERSWRYEEGSVIDRAARLVNRRGDETGLERDAREAMALLGLKPLPPPWRMGEAAGKMALEAYRPLLDAATAGGVGEAFAQLDRFRILCALREGPYGVAGLNRAIEEAVRREKGRLRDERDYPGRVVMVSANDHGRKLYNGDVGVMVRDAAGGLAVWFRAGEERQGKKVVPLFRSFTTAQLPPHQTAFAMTVHKSQGSEFDRVALLLPPDPDHPVLTRELLYTAVTRARSRVEVWGTAPAFLAAVARRTSRSSGLRDLLWGQASFSCIFPGSGTL